MARRKGPKGIFGFILAGLSALVSTTLIVLMSLTACDVLNIIPEYVTVTFVGDHNEVLDKIEILEFSKAEYSGPMPTKEPDEKGPYIFIGWNKRLNRVWHDTTAKAKFLPLSFFDFGGVGELPDIDLDKIPKVPVMQLTAPTAGIHYLRQRSFGDYSFGTWSDAPKYTGRRVTPIGETFTNPSNYAGVIGKDNALFKPTPLSIKYLKDFEYTPVPQYSTQTDLKSDSDAYFKHLYGKDQTYETDSYFVDPINVPDTLARLKRANVADEQIEEIRKYERFAQSNYRTVNKEAKNIIKDIIREEGIKSSDNNVYQEVVKAIASRAEFNILASGSRDPNEDAIIKFLTKTKKGNSSLFAATATQMFRSLNIPSRYVSGYIAAVTQESVNVPMDVYNLQVWNWCEVFVKDVGWVAIDPSFEAVKTDLANGKVPGALPGDSTSIDLEMGLPDPEMAYVSKVYDDKPFKVDEVIKVNEKTKNDIKSRGLTLKIEIEGLKDFVDVGQKVCDVDVKLFKGKIDVTKKYQLTVPIEKVMLEIVPIQLTITLDKDVFVKYDGNYHSCEYHVKGNLPNHEVVFYPDEYSNPGEYEISGSTDQIAIYDKNDPMRYDKKKNYTITIEKGSLVIYKEVN